MNDQERSAVITRIVNGLLEGGWIGKTHVQKAVFFAQEAAGLDLGFRYVIHHYGPYSFELNAFMESLQYQGLLQIERASDGYGYEVKPGSDTSNQTLAPSVEKKVSEVTRVLAGQGTSDMELLATAFYVLHRYGGSAEDEPNINRVKELKPRFQREKVINSLKEAQDIYLILRT